MSVYWNGSDLGKKWPWPWRFRDSTPTFFQRDGWKPQSGFPLLRPRFSSNTYSRQTEQVDILEVLLSKLCWDISYPNWGSSLFSSVPPGKYPDGTSPMPRIFPSELFSTYYSPVILPIDVINFKYWLRHCATSRKFAGSIPDEAIRFFNWPNPSSRNMALGSTQPLTEMSTRNHLGGKGRPACKADNLTAICGPIV
jgi:hypothetical protein